MLIEIFKERRYILFELILPTIQCRITGYHWLNVETVASKSWSCLLKFAFASIAPQLWYSRQFINFLFDTFL